MGLDSDSPLSLGEVGTEGVAVDSLEDMERLFEGIPMGEITTSMTINAPAMVLLACSRSRGEAGRPARGSGRHQPERHTQGVHRPEGVALPARAFHACLQGHARLRDRAHAPLEHCLHLRLPHPRGREHRRRSWLSPSRTASRTWRLASRRASTWTTSLRASPSFSTRT